MPRIPVRTEPYTSSTRQHRHFKSKRDLILRTLGKSSYINGSQFVIAWISAKGEVETYASEMLQEAVDQILDLELLKGLALQVRDGADQKREQLEEIQRKRREDGGLLDEQGKVLDEWADMEPAEMASHLLRSAKKAKAEKVAAEKAAKNGEMNASASSSASAKSKGKQPIRPPLTPLRQLKEVEGAEETLVAEEEEDEEEVDEEEEDDEDEGEEEDDGQAEDGARDVVMKIEPDAGQISDVGLIPNDVAVNLSLARAHHQTAIPQSQEEPEVENGDVTLVDSSFTTMMATPSSESPFAMKQKTLQEDQQRSGSAPNSITANVRQVQVTMAGSPLSIRTSSKATGMGKRGMVMTATPSRPSSAFPSHAFVTPSTSHAGRPTGIIAPTPKSGKTSGLMNNVLEGTSGISKPTAMLGPLLTLDKPHIPRPLAHVRTPSLATRHSMSLSGTPNTPSIQTRSITVRSADLVDWYAARFYALQQATCKLVVKTWIKVIEPKKQSKFPYNRGEDSKPSWWPEHIRHKEPDHLQKPERAQILCSIIRSSVVPVSKLELSTAEATAYISQPKMKILREVYKVAKEDERKRNLGDVNTDIVVNVPASPVSAAVTLPRPTILEEMEMQMTEDISGQRSRRPSNMTVASEKEYQVTHDLASPCVIVPSTSAAFAAATRHQKGGSIGESVFLGAGAMKKRKLDDLTESNKENVNPANVGSSKSTKTRKTTKTPLTELGSASRNSMTRPQSTGGIRKGKQTTRSGQRNAVAMNDLTYAPSLLPLSGIGSPLIHPSNMRPWSAAGARSQVGGIDASTWMTSSTPMNQRQQRMQQVQGEGIVRPMSSDSALAGSSHFAPNGVYNGNNIAQPAFAGPAGHNPVPGGMLHHPGSAHGQANLDMYLTTDANGQVQMLPPNMIPIPSASRNSFALHQNPSQPNPGLQYVPYGVQQQGMPPFSSVPHQGTFMVYESNPQIMRTNSMTSSGSSGGDSRPHSQRLGTGHLSHQQQQQQQQQLEQQQQHMQQSSQNHATMGAGQGYMYSHMQYSSLGFQPMYVPEDGMTTPTPAATSAAAAVANGGQLHMKPMDHTNHIAPGASGDGAHANQQATITTGMNGPMAMEPSQPPPEMSEMETVEREFVKFSDGSDRENFWTHAAL
ncbi:hypothetical protein QFC24_002523 [Naganishia onofrii]|uniref:Uncharacterized protein n=1 Tax=Naganishia onofrii TaxID=1851511 RepID=A0ACC2XNU6_9TREE|nr:hypothetical protein QFC24_002523 [Naganishia onofrii]